MKLYLSCNWGLAKGSDEELEQLKKLLTVKDESAIYTNNYRKGLWDGTVKLYKNTKVGVLFGAGLSDYIQRNLDGVVFEIVDTRPKLEVESGYSLPVKLRDYQEEAISKCIEKQRGLLSIPTAGGKTWIAVALFKTFKAKKYLYLIHRYELLWQLKELFETVFPVEEIGINDLSKKYIVAMVQTIYASLKKSFLPELKDIEVLVVDEAHHAGARSWSKVIMAMENASVKIGLTGTVPSGRSPEVLGMIGAIGDTIYEVDCKKLIEDEYVVGPYVIFYQGDWCKGIDLGIDIRRVFGKMQGKEYWELARKKVLVENEKRNKFIAELVRDRKNVLIVVDMLEHGEILSKMIGCPFTWSGLEERKELFEKFKKGEINYLVSSPILEEGIDVSGIEVVVMASGGKSKRKLLQRIGRGMRKQEGKEKVEVIDLWDDYPPLLERHSRQRLRIYRAMDFPVEIKKIYEKLS